MRNCDECSFSRGGDRFAAVNGYVIELYSTYSFQLCGVLKGHNGKVKSITWSLDDTKLTSCGLDGAVCVTLSHLLNGRR
jgi:WD40 repeat protein